LFNSKEKGPAKKIAKKREGGRRDGTNFSNQVEMHCSAVSNWKFIPKVQLTTFQMYLAGGHLKKR
jgi:hypothetical protein